MLRLIAGLCLALPLLASAGSDAARAEDGGLRVSALTQSQAAEFDGCSCAFYLADGGALTGWYSDGAFQPVLNIDGKAERFTSVEEAHEHAGEADRAPQVGDRTTYTLTSDHAQAELRCRISHSCQGESECESVEYVCDADVRMGGRSLVVPVEGGCGC